MKELNARIEEYSKKVTEQDGYIKKALNALARGKREKGNWDIEDLRQELFDVKRTRQLYFRFLKDLESIKESLS